MVGSNGVGEMQRKEAVDWLKRADSVEMGQARPERMGTAARKVAE